MSPVGRSSPRSCYQAGRGPREGQVKKKINKRKLQALQLNATECLQLSLFVANNRDWVARYAVPLETVVRQSLRSRWIELLRIQKVEPHPVYEVFLRLGRSSPATKTGIELAVRQAFAAAGRSVSAKFAHAVLRGDRAKVTVLVDSWLKGRNRIRPPHPKPFLIGRR
jgi:hypothetical protein